MKGQKGFTLVELLVVLSIMGILMAMAAPGVLEWRRNAQYKEAAQLASATLRSAKGRSINVNQRIRAVFDLDNNTVTTNRVLDDGSLSLIGSSEFAAGIVLKGGTDCTAESGTVSLTFNPNGSSGTGYLCIFDGTSRKYRVGVSSSTTGRILFQKPKGASAWE